MKKILIKFFKLLYCLYHPTLGAKYAINIVTPIDYQYNSVNKQCQFPIDLTYQKLQKEYINQIMRTQRKDYILSFKNY